VDVDEKYHQLILNCIMFSNLELTMQYYSLSNGLSHSHVIGKNHYSPNVKDMKSRLMSIQLTQAQFKRSYYNHHKTAKLCQYFTLNEANQQFSIIRVETDSNSGLILNTSKINQFGELLSVDTFTFSSTGFTNHNLAILGVFDQGSERIVCLSFFQNSSQAMQFFTIKYNKYTGAETGRITNSSIYKRYFVKSVRHGNELVNYAIDLSGNLYRVAVDANNISSISEEPINVSTSNIGSVSYFDISRGLYLAKVLVYNGKEVLSFAKGNKRIIVRNAANSYSEYQLSSNSAGATGLFELPNGNLFVYNSSEFFQLNNSFSIVQSQVVDVNQYNYSEIKLLNNQFHQFCMTTSNKAFYRVFDLNFNMLSSRPHEFRQSLSMEAFWNGLVLVSNNGAIGNVCSLYNGQTTQSTVPIQVEYFTTALSDKPLNDYYFVGSTDNLQFTLGLGDQVFSYNSLDNTPLSYDSTRVMYGHYQFYVAETTSDTLGQDTVVNTPVFLPGPYTTAGKYSDLVEDKYIQGFYVSKEMIQNHLNALSSGVPNYVAPYGIRSWPAHGDVSLGQAANLAPFVDVNGNGFYEPYNGDYPSIYGDYCFFSITHDNPMVSKSACIETHSYKYWFDCDTSDAFQNTIFIKSIY
jgi:hypothetical protein